MSCRHLLLILLHKQMTSGRSWLPNNQIWWTQLVGSLTSVVLNYRYSHLYTTAPCDDSPYKIEESAANGVITKVWMCCGWVGDWAVKPYWIYRLTYQYNYYVFKKSKQTSIYKEKFVCNFTVNRNHSYK